MFWFAKCEMPPQVPVRQGLVPNSWHCFRSLWNPQESGLARGSVLPGVDLEVELDAATGLSFCQVLVSTTEHHSSRLLLEGFHALREPTFCLLWVTLDKELPWATC